ncbi:1 concanamycin induced protein c [Mycena kentingensis (nom. inval.)]|nr:1 concanamycin induced protein c [Mycena kentingensis (nom. inval.)]
MGFFHHESDEAQAYQTVVNAPHKAALSHELIAGAAAYEAAKAYQNHVERNGAPESHSKAKEVMAGFAGAFIDRVVETKGLDFLDKEKAKHEGELILVLGADGAHEWIAKKKHDAQLGELEGLTQRSK